MKIKITTKNRLGISNEVLELLSNNNIDIINIEVVTGFIHLETEDIDKLIQRNIATKIMQVNGVEWVEDVHLMPANEHAIFLTSLLNAISDPVIGINNKGEIVYKNIKAVENFNLNKNAKSLLKEIFTDSSWATQIDVAATGKLPVNIHTIAGLMLVEVRALKQRKDNKVGAVLIFHKPESIATRSHIIKGAEIKSFDGLITHNEKFKDIILRAKHMSNTDVSLMLYGESGVGKRTLAQIIHHSGTRQKHLFSSLNCAECNSVQIENEIFGIANPNTGKAGLLEITNGGTFYIESIQEMPQACQNKLLKFIQKKSFTRVGGTQKRQADIKIVASCPSSLNKYVQKQQFNQELFYALDITQLNIPPLRSRKEDVEPLALYFLEILKSQGGKNIDELSFSALSKIKSYFWPGNISQLKELIYKASMTAVDNTIQENDIQIDGHVNIQSNLENRSLPEAVAEFEKHFLQHWYQKYSSTRKLAAQLGVSHTTIAQKLNKYEIK